MQPIKKRRKLKSRALTPKSTASSLSTASSFSSSSSSSSSLTLIPTLKELQGLGKPLATFEGFDLHWINRQKPELPKTPLSRASRTPSPAGKTKEEKLASTLKKKRKKEKKKQEKEKKKKERQEQEQIEKSHSETGEIKIDDMDDTSKRPEQFEVGRVENLGFVGENALLDHEARSATVTVTSEKCILLRLRRYHLWKCQLHELFGYDLLAI